jgi:methyl-accepting chemotaxis protein
MDDEEWRALTADEKFDWLRSEVQRIITHMQRVAAPLAAVGNTVSSLDARMSEIEKMVKALTDGY